MATAALPAEQFSLALTKKAGELGLGSLAKLQRAVGLGALAGTVGLTPVDEDGGGRAKGSWQMTIGAPASSESGIIDPNGSATIAAGSAVIAQVNPANLQTIYLSSNLPYIRVLEFGLYGTGRANKGPRTQQFTRRRVAAKNLKSLARLGVNPEGFVRFRRVKLRTAKTIKPRTTPEGYSTQAPRGMLRITVAELRTKLASKGFIREALAEGIGNG